MSTNLNMNCSGHATKHEFSICGYKCVCACVSGGAGTDLRVIKSDVVIGTDVV